jgi:hypothetical protein
VAAPRAFLAGPESAEIVVMSRPRRGRHRAPPLPTCPHPDTMVERNHNRGMSTALLGLMVNIACACGKSLMESPSAKACIEDAARITGIPSGTIRRWLAEECLTRYGATTSPTASTTTRSCNSANS